MSNDSVSFAYTFHADHYNNSFQYHPKSRSNFHCATRSYNFNKYGLCYTIVMKNKLENEKFKKIVKAEIDQILSNLESDLNALEKKQHNLHNEENTLVFDKLMESHSLISKVNEYNYISKTQDIDTMINIAVTLFSISLSLLIAFISVPSLGGNSIPALIVVFFSSILLIVLLWYRNKFLKNLKTIYLEGMVTHLKRITDRVDEHLDIFEAKSKDVQEKINSILSKTNALKKKYIRTDAKKAT